MFVVYHKDTTRYLKNHPGVKTDKYLFGSMGAAKAAITRAVKETALKVQPIVASDFLIADSTEFHNSIEKSRPVKNILTGTQVMERINTPWSCSVASETYHST